MPMLHPCPRCTQALPASAKFCRRCGAVVGGLPVASSPTPERNSHGSLVTAGLAALVAGAAIVAASLFFVHGTQTTVLPQLIQAPAQPQPVPTVIVARPPPPVIVQERHVEGHPTEQEIRWARERQHGR